MMIVSLLLALPLQEILPHAPATWPELREVYPSAWEFPMVDASGHPLPSAAFEQELLTLARDPLFEDPTGELVVYLGDLVRLAQAYAFEATAVRNLLDGFRPILEERRMAFLEGLLLSDRIRDEDWKPSEDLRDGIHFGPTWDLPEDLWIEHGGSRSVEQAASLILADLSAIKRAEHDFPSYFDFPENSYLNVDPVPGTYLRHAPAEGGGCEGAALKVRFRSDLPFPFSTYALDLGILHRTRADEDLITYVYGDGEDIHWLAGYDRFLTVRDRQGKIVATLLIRQLALDIAGVPDKSKHRREGIRSGIGNLRRGAEALQEGPIASEASQAGIPAFEVKGQ